jgi:3-methylfumaryl-CoA hydratase
MIAHDTVGPQPVAAIMATLVHPATAVPAGTALPARWHGLYFLPMTCSSMIEDVAFRPGRSGKPVFLKMRHEQCCSAGADPALLEWHDIVYRDARQPGDAQPLPQPAPHGSARSCPMRSGCFGARR